MYPFQLFRYQETICEMKSASTPTFSSHTLSIPPATPHRRLVPGVHQDAIEAWRAAAGAEPLEVDHHRGMLDPQLPGGVPHPRQVLSHGGGGRDRQKGLDRRRTRLLTHIC